MSAKEMFERLGYNCKKSSNYTIIGYYKIYKEQDGSKTKIEIKFYVNNTFDIVTVNYSEEYEFQMISSIGIDILQAINKQIEELGWLGSDDNE